MGTLSYPYSSGISESITGGAIYNSIDRTIKMIPVQEQLKFAIIKMDQNNEMAEYLMALYEILIFGKIASEKLNLIDPYTDAKTKIQIRKYSHIV